MKRCIERYDNDGVCFEVETLLNIDGKCYDNVVYLGDKAYKLYEERASEGKGNEFLNEMLDPTGMTDSNIAYYVAPSERKAFEAGIKTKQGYDVGGVRFSAIN